MKKIIITVVAALLLVGAISYGVWAEGRGPGSGPMVPGGTNLQNGPRGTVGSLNLTYDQELKLLDIRQQFQRETLDLRFAMQRKGLELRQLWSVKPLNQSAIEAKTKETTALRVQMATKSDELRAKMRTVVTPEQQKIFDSQPNGQGFRVPGYGRECGAAATPVVTVTASKRHKRGRPASAGLPIQQFSPRRIRRNDKRTFDFRLGTFDCLFTEADFDKRNGPVR